MPWIRFASRSLSDLEYYKQRTLQINFIDECRFIWNTTNRRNQDNKPKEDMP